MRKANASVSAVKQCVSCPREKHLVCADSGHRVCLVQGQSSWYALIQAIGFPPEIGKAEKAATAEIAAALQRTPQEVMDSLKHDSVGVLINQFCATCRAALSERRVPPNCTLKGVRFPV